MNNASEIAVTQDALKKTSGEYENKIKKGVMFLFCAGGALFIGVAILGIHSRNTWNLEVQQLTDKAARTIVQVVHPTGAMEAISLQLPGQTMPYTDAPIYAQTSGYLKKWYFDIGTEVKAGAVLAEIDTPQVDAQLAQAQAQLKVAQATRDLSKVTYQRYQDLFQRNVIAAQDFDTAGDNYGQNQGTVIADQANVNRMEALEAFKIVRAKVILRSRREHCSSHQENPLWASSVLMGQSRSDELRSIAISGRHWKSPKVCRNRIKSLPVLRPGLWMALTLSLRKRHETVPVSGMLFFQGAVKIESNRLTPKLYDEYRLDRNR